MRNCVTHFACDCITEKVLKLEKELAEEKAKSQRLVEALEGFLDDCHNPVFDDHRLAYVHAQIYRYTVKKSRQALKEYKGEK